MALALLRGSEEKFSDIPQFWRIAAMTYQTLGESEDSQKALGKYRELVDSVIDRASLEVAMLVNAGGYQEADKVLAEMEPTVEGDQRRQIELMRVRALATGDLLDDAFRVVSNLNLKPAASDVQLLQIGIEIALAKGDFETAKQWEAMFSKATQNSSESRYLSARRRLLTYGDLSQSERRTLDADIAALRSERPRWYPTVVLSADHWQLQGDKRRALF